MVFEPHLLAGKFDRFEDYARARRECPVSQHPLSGVFSVLRYEDCYKVLRHHGDYSSDRRKGTAPGFNYAKYFQPSMIRIDPPDHSRQRSRVPHAFTSTMVTRLEPRIREVVDGLIDRAWPRRRIELMSEFAYPLPETIITELMGVPTADRAEVKRWGNGIIHSQRVGIFAPMTDQDAQVSMEAGEALNAYFLKLLEAKRAAPADDLITHLVQPPADAAPLTDAELAAICILLLTAGHTTTAKLIGSAAAELARNLPLRRRLLDDSALIPGAIEETLRMYAPIQGVVRYTTREVDLAGFAFPPKATVAVWIGSANRDEAAFEDAATFQPTRGTPHRHMPFGVGIHYCLGATLGTLEARIAVETLLRRMPEFRRTDDAPLRTPQDPTLFGPERLELEF